jgi:Flp pilus assembly protein TadD
MPKRSRPPPRPARSPVPSGNVRRPWYQRRDFQLGALLVLAVFVIYLPVWQAGFIWDDDDHVTANPCIVGPLGLVQIWSTNNARYYPLVLTTFWLEHAAWGLQPTLFHLVNVLLQGICAVLLWRVLRSLDVPGAWLGAALWAVHPVQVETVAWITELKNIQSGFFYLLAVLFFVRWLKARQTPPPSPSSYAWTLVFSALAMASKSSTVVLPVILGLVAWRVEGQCRARTLLRLLPVLLMSAAAAAMAMWTVDLQGVNQDVRWIRTWPERFITAGRVFWFYLDKLAWPHPLIFIYPRWNLHPENGISYLPLAAAAALLLVCWWKSSTWGRDVFFALACYVAALLPVLGLVEHYFLRYSFVADHLQYLAGMAPLALAGAGLTTLLQRTLPQKPRLQWTLCALLLLALGSVSFSRAWTYQNEETLWTDTVTKNPASWMAYNNLGTLCLDRGQVESAVADFDHAVAIDPTLPQPYYNLGLAAVQTGQTDAAAANFRQALSLDPAYEDAHYNLGKVFLEQHRPAEAEAEFRRTLELNPQNAEAHNNLGVALLRQHRFDDASAEFQKALQLDPKNEQAQANLDQAQSARARFP